MRTVTRTLVAGALAAGVLQFLVIGVAHGAEWKEVQGKTFKAEAVEALGPFAVFSEKSTIGRCLPVQALPLTELARFSAAVKNRSPRADDWAQATSDLTAELRGNLEKVEQKQLVPYAVNGRPEPSLVVVLFLNKEAGDSWKLIWPSMDSMWKIAQLKSGVIEIVACGVNYMPKGWLEMVKDIGAPWALLRFDDQPQLKTLRRFVPRSGYRAVVFNRDGVPLFGAFDPDEAAVKEFWKKVASFVTLLDPTNPFSWRPLAYYRTAEQMAAHPAGRLEPELIGYAIRPGSLVRNNVRSFDATLRVSANGVVSEIAELKSEKPLSPNLEEAIRTTLQKAVLVPAIENGQPVESEFVYHFRDDSPSP